MRICTNGVTRDMTPDESAEFMSMAPIEIVPTDTERLDAVEAAIMELAEVIAGG